MHPLLRAAAERQLGLFTAVDARRAGYEHGEIQRLCSSGTWHRLRRGVYLTADALPSAEDRGRRHQVACLAVLLELDRPSAVLSHASAARLWGIPVRRGLLGSVRLTDPTLSRQGRGYRVTQAPLRTGEVVRRGPFRLTSAARTLLDLLLSSNVCRPIVTKYFSLQSLSRSLWGVEDFQRRSRFNVHPKGIIGVLIECAVAVTVEI